MIDKPKVTSDTEDSASIKTIPKFKSEAEERNFWNNASIEATDYFESSGMRIAKFIKLKPSQNLK
jgi:hypothetical protein